MLNEFGDGIWIADGPEVVAALSFHYPTRMAIIRLAGGALLVWSPVALTPALKAAIAPLGEVRWLVAPNTLHHLFVADWQRAFPAARLYAAPGLDRKRPDLVIDGTFGADLAPPWSGEIDHVVVPGNVLTTEVVFFHRASRTAIFTDLLQHLPGGWYSGWRAHVARLDGMTGPTPAVPQKFRLAFTDRPAARAALRRILAWPTEKLLLAHGAPGTTDGQAILRRAFHWLLP
jgi:hypothetical protein